MNTDIGILKDVKTYWEQVRPMGESICQSLADEVRKLGFADLAQRVAPWERCRFDLQKDPADGGAVLVGNWLDADGRKQGSIIFHSDGSFFAEYDVIQNHPGDKRWFVEAVNAWGNSKVIKVEPRLLAVSE